MLSENPYYLPQRSCGKLMFLHLCVILFTGVVSVHGGLCPGELCPAGGGRSVQGEVSIQRVFVQQRVLCPETPPWTETPTYSNMRAVRILPECILVRNDAFANEISFLINSSLIVQKEILSWKRCKVCFAYHDSISHVNVYAC